ncbi:putative response regulator [Pseudomonas aeruginosa]|nr:putative response regulator [Pseudomonas aeruginosa]
MQDWCDGGGALDEARLDELLGRFGASFGSALRARWRLPLELRRLIAAAYQFGGVLSREELILSLATQAASLPEDDAEQLAESKAARMLGWTANDWRNCCSPEPPSPGLCPIGRITRRVMRRWAWARLQSSLLPGDRLLRTPAELPAVDGRERA